jgi:hypothetical protein
VNAAELAPAPIRKSLRTIRLDPSDTFVFNRAADSGEWAVTGSFLFAHAEIEALGPKQRAAFRSGFLGVSSFGWSTLAVVQEMRADEHEAALTELATRLMRDLGAPDVATARAAAAEELAFAASLCDHPVNTLVALHRTLDGGELRERFRTLTPKAEEELAVTAKGAFRAFQFVEVEGEDGDAGGVQETVDLMSLMQDGRAKDAGKGHA